MLRSLDIPQTERSRYFSETDIISAEWGFSACTYLYRIFKLKEGCTPAECWEKMAANVTPEYKKQDQLFFAKYQKNASRNEKIS